MLGTQKGPRPFVFLTLSTYTLASQECGLPLGYKKKDDWCREMDASVLCFPGSVFFFFFNSNFLCKHLSLAQAIGLTFWKITTVADPLLSTPPPPMLQTIRKKSRQILQIYKEWE